MFGLVIFISGLILSSALDIYISKSFNNSDDGANTLNCTNFSSIIQGFDFIKQQQRKIDFRFLLQDESHDLILNTRVDSLLTPLIDEISHNIFFIGTSLPTLNVYNYCGFSYQLKSLSFFNIAFEFHSPVDCDLSASLFNVFGGSRLSIFTISGCSFRAKRNNLSKKKNQIRTLFSLTDIDVHISNTSYFGFDWDFSFNFHSEIRSVNFFNVSYRNCKKFVLQVDNPLTSFHFFFHNLKIEDYYFDQNFIPANSSEKIGFIMFQKTKIICLVFTGANLIKFIGGQLILLDIIFYNMSTPSEVKSVNFCSFVFITETKLENTNDFESENMKIVSISKFKEKIDIPVINNNLLSTNNSYIFGINQESVNISLIDYFPKSNFSLLFQFLNFENSKFLTLENNSKIIFKLRNVQHLEIILIGVNKEMRIIIIKKLNYGYEFQILSDSYVISTVEMFNPKKVNSVSKVSDSAYQKRVLQAPYSSCGDINTDNSSYKCSECISGFGVSNLGKCEECNTFKNIFIPMLFLLIKLFFKLYSVKKAIMLTRNLNLNKISNTKIFLLASTNTCLKIMNNHYLFLWIGTIFIMKELSQDFGNGGNDKNTNFITYSIDCFYRQFSKKGIVFTSTYMNLILTATVILFWTLYFKIKFHKRRKKKNSHNKNKVIKITKISEKENFLKEIYKHNTDSVSFFTVFLITLNVSYDDIISSVLSGLAYFNTVDDFLYPKRLVNQPNYGFYEYTAEQYLFLIIFVSVAFMFPFLIIWR